jgi:hypothetical protein
VPGFVWAIGIGAETVAAGYSLKRAYPKKPITPGNLLVGNNAAAAYEHSTECRKSKRIPKK